jgi:sulfur relay (sulfurtransferase) DsrF/TusC family protein
MTFFTFGFTLSCFKITSFIIDNAVFHFITQQDSQEYQTKLAKLEDVRLHLLDHYRPLQILFRQIISIQEIIDTYVHCVSNMMNQISCHPNFNLMLNIPRNPMVLSIKLLMFPFLCMNILPKKYSPIRKSI